MPERIDGYLSEDGNTGHRWWMPDYSLLDRFACAIGMHVASRKFVAEGWIDLDQIGRAYCACGRVEWMWFAGAYVQKRVGQPGGHARWLALMNDGSEIAHG